MDRSEMERLYPSAKRVFTLIHYVNFIAIVIQIITGTNQKRDQRVNSFGSGGNCGNRPGLHHYILCRSTMSASDFRKYLSENYKWWRQHSCYKEDTRFFDFFLGPVMQEILVLRDEWANPAIDLEVTLARIIAFFMKHLECDSPRQTFLILMHILSSKCFCVSRKIIAKRWRKKWRKTQILRHSDVEIIRRLRIQAFFLRELSNLFISNPSLKQVILNFRENDARLFYSISEGFKMLTTLFLTNDVPFPIQQQTHICISLCNFVYRFEKEKNDELWYQMMRRNFHLVQNMDKKFRVDLIGRSHLLFILIWRMFNLSHQNRFRRIPLFMSAKLMLSRYYFSRLLTKDRFIDQFLSMKK